MHRFITRDMLGRMETNAANTASRLITVEFLLAVAPLFSVSNVRTVQSTQFMLHALSRGKKMEAILVAL